MKPINAIVSLTGPSLSGKTTLMRTLQSRGGFKEIVSHTTRPSRAGERDMVDYYFVSDEEFESVEMAERVEYGGYKYGVAVHSVKAAIQSGQVPIVIVEPNGAMQLARVANQYGWKHIKVFINITPSLQRHRFAQRMFQDIEADWEIYRRRFLLTRAELEWVSLMPWDYCLEQFEERSQDWQVNQLTRFIFDRLHQSESGSQSDTAD